MAFKQPRVPEYREREGADRYIRSLVLFLKDFCMDVWTANNQRTGEIDAVRGGLSEMHYPVNSVCGKTGDVTLTAGDVGARPGSWMPTASDVGALAQGGTAADSSKLGGRTWDEHLLDIYPIGSIYMSAGSASPASLFGGTWESIGGRFLLGADAAYAAGRTGGEATHKLTTNEIPGHQHGPITIGNDGVNIIHWLSNSQSSSKNSWGFTYDTEMSGNELYSGYAGGGGAHNNMPPYLAVYMWKRVS